MFFILNIFVVKCEHGMCVCSFFLTIFNVCQQQHHEHHHHHRCSRQNTNLLWLTECIDISINQRSLCDNITSIFRQQQCHSRGCIILLGLNNSIATFKLLWFLLFALSSMLFHICSQCYGSCASMLYICTWTHLLIFATIQFLCCCLPKTFHFNK